MAPMIFENTYYTRKDKINRSAIPSLSQKNKRLFTAQ